MHDEARRGQLIVLVRLLVCTRYAYAVHCTSCGLGRDRRTRWSGPYMHGHAPCWCVMSAHSCMHTKILVPGMRGDAPRLSVGGVRMRKDFCSWWGRWCPIISITGGILRRILLYITYLRPSLRRLLQHFIDPRSFFGFRSILLHHNDLRDSGDVDSSRNL